MRTLPLGDIKDETLKNHLQFIFENAMDKEIQVVTAEPTTDSLPVGERRQYGNYIYENINGTVYKYAITAV